MSCMSIQWIEPYYDVILNMIPRDARIITDVGAGSGIFGYILKQTRSAKVIGIEPYHYDLTHYDIHIKRTFQDTNPKLMECDVLVSTECIEHMEKDTALKFLEDIKQIASTVIIATPYKFEQQPEYDSNPYQSHKCVITEDDFKRNGYDVTLIGTMSLSGMTGRFVIHPKLKPLSRFLGIKITNIVGKYEDKYKT